MQLELERPDCDLCGHSGQRHLFAVKDRRYGGPGEFKLVECEQCSLRYVSPRPVASTIHAWYPDDYRAHRTPTRSTLDEVKDFFDELWNVVPEPLSLRFVSDLLLRPARPGIRAPRPASARPRRRLRQRRQARLPAAARRLETYGVDFSAQAVENARAARCRRASDARRQAAVRRRLLRRRDVVALARAPLLAQGDDGRGVARLAPRRLRHLRRARPAESLGLEIFSCTGGRSRRRATCTTSRTRR